MQSKECDGLQCIVCMLYVVVFVGQFRWYNKVVVVGSAAMYSDNKGA